MDDRNRAGPLRWAVLVVGAGLALQLGGCGRTSPSALDPHGPGAERVAGLWWLLFWISAVVFAVVCLLVVVALARRRGTATPWCGAAAASS